MDRITTGSVSDFLSRNLGWSKFSDEAFPGVEMIVQLQLQVHELQDVQLAEICACAPTATKSARLLVIRAAIRAIL